MAETETTLSHEEVARQLMAQIRALVLAHLPQLGGMSAEDVRRLLNAASVPDEFLEKVAIAIEGAPEVGVAHRLTAGESREMIAFSKAFLDFADQVQLLVSEIRATVLELRHDVGQRALGVYGTVKSMKRSNRKVAASNVTALRRALGRAGRKKAAEAPVKTPPDDLPKTTA